MTRTPPAAVTSALTDREAMCVACLCAPDEDTPRLALADFVEERGDEEWATLIRCQIELPRTPKFSWRCECKVCGNVPDEHGELEHGKGCYQLDEDGGGSEWFNPEEKWSELTARESALLAILRSRLLPACLQCRGDGRHLYGDFPTGEPNYSDSVACRFCSGSGVCAGTIERGLGVVEVPLAVLGDERVFLIRPATLSEEGVFYPSQLETVFRSSAFARDCVRRGVGFRVSDREPMDSQSAHEPHDTCYDWWDEGDTRSRAHLHRHSIPHSLFVEVKKLARRMANNDLAYCEFPTADAAQRALGAVLVRAAMNG